MAIYLLATNPDIFISTEALADAKSFFDQANALDPGKEYVLVFEWCEHSGLLPREFMGGLDELKQELSHEDFSRELTKRRMAHGVPIPPHVSLGASEKEHAPPGDVVELSGMQIVTKKETFPDIVAQRNVIDLSKGVGSKLILVAGDAEQDGPDR